MITYQKGNLLNVTSGIIAHGVNCQGVMGSGVALQIRQKWPAVYEKYKSECKNGDNLLGSCGAIVDVDEDLYVANLYTQDFFGKAPTRYVSYDAVDMSFKRLMSLNSSGNIGNKKHDIHIPMIGAGLGGGNWSVIELIVREQARYFSTNVVVWEYNG